MLSFTERRQEFLRTLRTKIASNNATETPKDDFALNNDTDDELMALLEKKFDELFGPLDDDN